MSDMSDPLSERCRDLLDGSYDCVDRIVLNAYFNLAQSPGGFRVWWRMLYGAGADDNLDNAHLIRFAGRFARRVKAYAKQQGILLIRCQRGERKHQIAAPHLPDDPGFRGVFCILTGRAPAPLRDIRRYGDGGIDISRKTPLPYVNYYFFHIMDHDWGHVIIRFCPHPPFNAQIILNGHEYVERRARRRRIPFVKEGNCFTDVSDAAGLAKVAETMRAPRSVGRLVQVCERWIYSACLCFALDLGEQQRSGFRYGYSVYQAEYSRNLLFRRGRAMEQTLNRVIDRVRAPLNLKTLKTIFGRKHRPFRRNRRGELPRFEVAVERPVYDLTVFKIHFGKLTVKAYSKGERVLRVEAVAHNTDDLRCGRVIEKFPVIIAQLRAILERFLAVLDCVDASFIDGRTLAALRTPGRLGAARVGGVDINQPRMRAVMGACVALAAHPGGFVISQLAASVRDILGRDQNAYRPTQAAYDLRKLRAKGVLRKIPRTRRYTASPEGLRAISAIIILREKVMEPLLARAGKLRHGPKPTNHSALDEHYETIQKHMQKLFEHIGIAA